jgi:hypothetical protein
MCPRKEHTIRIILRTVVVIFLTGFFYIFGKSNEGYAAETKSPPIRQELVFGDEFIPRPKDLAPPASTVGLIYRDATPSVTLDKCIVRASADVPKIPGAGLDRLASRNRL